MKPRLLIISLAAMSLSVACDNAEYSVIDNRVYLEQALGINQQISSLTIEGDYELELTVRLGQATDHDVKVTLAPDESFVDEYNSVNNTDYMALPAEYYDFNTEAVIPAGRVSADPVVVTIKQFKTSGSPYAFPVKIVSAEGAVVANKTSRMLYRLSAPHMQKTVTIASTNHATRSLSESFSSNKWTVEFWVNVSDFTNRTGQGGGTFDGCNLIGFGGWFLRYWNAGAIKPGLPCLQWQGSAYFDSTQFWLAKTWYHVAYVSDGTTIQMYVDGEPDNSLTTSASNSFSQLAIGGGSYSWRNVTVGLAQIRIWNKDLGISQIKDAMNREVAADADGLFRYWKCDEGSGNILHESVVGDNITLNGNPAWSAELNFSRLKD